MIRPILYKESIKIRWLWLTLLGVNGAIMAVIAMDTHHLFVMDHPETVWYRTLHLGYLYYKPLKYTLVLTGTLLGLVQFLPEMKDERFRLSLHLPVPTHVTVMTHVLIGMGSAALIMAMDMGLLGLLTAKYFPREAVTTAWLTVLPWTMAGLSAYLGVTLGLLEPRYAMKILHGAVAIGVAGLYLRHVPPAGYGSILLPLLLPLALMIPGVLLPAYRFRFRRVSS